MFVCSAHGVQKSLSLSLSLFSSLPPCLPPPPLLHLCCLFLCLFLKMFYSYLIITHLNMFSKIQLVSKQPSLVILHNNVRIKSIFLSFFRQILHAKLVLNLLSPCLHTIRLTLQVI